MAHPVDCVCIRISNHGLNPGLILSLFKFFGETIPKGVSASKCKMGISLNLNLKRGIKVSLYLHTFSSKDLFWKFLGNSFEIF